MTQSPDRTGSPPLHNPTRIGTQLLLARGIERFHGGFLPEMFRILLVDLQLLGASSWLYRHLHLRDAALSTLQKEMVATVVNGKITGAA